MINKLKLAVLTLPLFAFFLATGCGSQPPHPNALNAFDGATYDSLTVAHGALTSLRAQVVSGYPKYVPVFNQAAAAYTTAFNGYALYRSTTANQTDIAVALDNLTVSVVALENAFISDMHASSANIINARRKAKVIRARAGASVTISDILTELEIAAAVAKAVPGAQPYAALAEMVIDATSQAVAAEVASSGQAIDLTTIQPVAPIA
jgi:hypothetical protein